jgi:hypothetical protein
MTTSSRCDILPSILSVVTRLQQANLSGLLKAYMIVNFRIYEINRDTYKLAQTFNKKYIYNNEQILHL